VGTRTTQTTQTTQTLVLLHSVAMSARGPLLVHLQGQSERGISHCLWSATAGASAVSLQTAGFSETSANEVQMGIEASKSDIYIECMRWRNC
jgi:hypothetical protein